MLWRKRPSIAMEIVRDYALRVLVAVKVLVKDVKAVAKTDAKQHAEVDVVKDAKGVVMPCVKAIV